MRLTLQSADEIRALYARGGITQIKIAKMFGVCQMTVSKVVRKVVYVEERPSEFARFFAKIDTSPGQGPNGDCHEWKGGCCWSGYGQFKRTRSAKQINASRMTWEFLHGPIPPKMEICHHCDNRKCCRDTHLFLGTHADNMRDAKNKGRMVRRST